MGGALFLLRHTHLHGRLLWIHCLLELINVHKISRWLVYCPICGVRREGNFHTFCRCPQATALWQPMMRLFITFRRFLTNYLDQRPTIDDIKGKGVISYGPAFASSSHVCDIEDQKPSLFWKPLKEGWVKLNVGGSFMLNNNACAGMVVCNHFGRIIISACRHRHTLHDAWYISNVSTISTSSMLLLYHNCIVFASVPTFLWTTLLIKRPKQIIFLCYFWTFLENHFLGQKKSIMASFGSRCFQRAPEPRVGTLVSPTYPWLATRVGDVGWGCMGPMWSPPPQLLSTAFIYPRKPPSYLSGNFFCHHTSLFRCDRSLSNTYC